MHRIQYGARLKVDDGDKVKRGQRLAEWDPYTRPILTEVDGIAELEDLIEGQSLAETVDESTGIAKRMVMDWRLNARSAGLKPAIIIKGKDGKIAKLTRGGEARYTLPVDSIIAVDPGAQVHAGDILARISMEIRPRPATSPAVCRVLRNSSRRAVRRTTRLSRNPRARCSSAATTRTSSASRSSRTKRAPSRSST